MTTADILAKIEEMIRETYDGEKSGYYSESHYMGQRLSLFNLKKFIEEADNARDSI